MRQIVFVLAATLLLPFGSLAGEPDYAALVAQLGHADFAVRNKAHERLARTALKAKTALLTAKDSTDAEVRLRVGQLLAIVEREEQWQRTREWLNENAAPLFGAERLKDRETDASDSSAEKPDPAREENTGYREEVLPDGTTQAHDLTLEWLARAQTADGRIDSQAHGAQVDADLEQTAFSLLAFLSVGHTEKAGMFKKNVRQAVSYLAAQMRADGAFLRKGQPVEGAAQAIATLALCEAAGMGNLAATKERAQRAISYCCGTFQSCEGGAKTGFGRASASSKPDLFHTTLFTLALRSGKIAALKVEADSFEGVIRFLESVDDKEGHAFSFVPGGKPTPHASVLGSLARRFLGWKREDLEPYVTPILANLDDFGADESDALWGWLATLLASQQAGEVWRTHRDVLHGNLRSSQGPDGSWRAGGNWQGAGTVFSTALRNLARTVHHYYVPLGDRE